jgi:hypothetical protein
MDTNDKELSGAVAEMYVGRPHATRGDELDARDKVYVKAQFVNRWTGDWTPQWVEYSDCETPKQFEDDADWLRHSYFATDEDSGRVEREFERCHSEPTWPEGRAAEKWEQTHLHFDENQKGEVI